LHPKSHLVLENIQTPN